MDKKTKQCVKMLRDLVSDVQGAPYPGSLENELYMIWYEHIQKNAIECFEFLDENIPKEQENDINNTLEQL